MKVNAGFHIDDAVMNRFRDVTNTGTMSGIVEKLIEEFTSKRLEERARRKEAQDIADGWAE